MAISLNNSILKSPLAQSINTEYHKLVTVLEQVPLLKRDVKTIEGTGGPVSVHDIIAYQIGWGKLLLNWYHAGQENIMPVMPGEGFSTWDYAGLAKHFYSKYRYTHNAQQEQELHNLVTEIIKIVESEYQIGNLDKLGVWPWCTLKSGKQWPLSKWVTINTVAPYKKATATIRKFLKSIHN